MKVTENSIPIRCGKEASVAILVYIAPDLRDEPIRTYPLRFVL